MKITDSFARELREAAGTDEIVRLLRDIPGTEAEWGSVLAVGRKWVAVSEVVDFHREDIFCVRIADLHRLQRREGKLVRRWFSRTGEESPDLPYAVDLDTTAGLLRSVRRSGQACTIEVEREDPDILFVGLVEQVEEKTLLLREIDPRARWGALSRWPLRDITRVKLYSHYVTVLSEIAGER